MLLLVNLYLSCFCCLFYLVLSAVIIGNGAKQKPIVGMYVKAVFRAVYLTCLHLIPLWERTWCHCIVLVTQEEMHWLFSAKCMFESKNDYQNTSMHVEMRHDLKSLLKVSWALWHLLKASALSPGLPHHWCTQGGFRPFYHYSDQEWSWVHIKTLVFFSQR